MTTLTPRAEAYRSALLNTCVRLARPAVPDLTLGNCLQNREFVAVAANWLQLPFFLEPIEPVMEKARQELVRQLRAVIAQSV